MKCPKCKKGEIKENISYRGFFNKEKIFTYFCPLCEFHKEKRIKISLGELNAELMAKRSGKSEDAESEVNFRGLSVKTKGNRNY